MKDLLLKRKHNLKSYLCLEHNICRLYVEYSFHKSVTSYGLA